LLLLGTYMYIAPEVYNCEKFTSRSDVYSIGIILWEMANRIVKGKYEKPYEEYKNLEFDFQILIQACMMNLRPTIPAETPEPLAELIRHTFLPDKDSRPDSPELYDKLVKLREDYNANKTEWDKSVGRPLKTSSSS
jgi:serine/threonine protein kinase